VFRDGVIATFTLYVTLTFVMVAESFQLLWFMSYLGIRGCVLFIFTF
jgi:hypothetical protein